MSSSANTKHKKKIVFVCTGNTCRSVIAEYLFKKIITDDKNLLDTIEVSSCGTAASVLYKVPEIVRILLKKEGAPSCDNHISTQIDENIFKDADKIFVMENHHKEYIETLFGKSQKVFLLGCEQEIPDPIGMPESFYIETFNTIKNNLIRLKEKL